ncbi:GNAT family N-acetyltransferase [Mycobacterium rhizamassiliense]|uniref:GNAT family N-acetyltransferase n=1 Tax=Mycobacterium rhizamassiliense TaxID=1841860 RepID=UPI00097DCE1C|nr:GNAT family N-acetyltransferase [Mycobacterium rhizamassiliense]
MKSPDVKIRRAEPTEFEKVAEMHYPVWRQSWSGIIEDFMLDLIATPKFWATVSYPDAVRRLGWDMWIAESGGKILGMAIFGPDAAIPDALYIEALYTWEQGRKLGIGVRLLNKAVRSHPSGDVILWCAERNSRARQFYEDNKFELDGRSYTWHPLPSVDVPHVGYRRAAAQA